MEKLFSASNWRLLQSGISLAAIIPMAYAVAHGWDGKRVFVKDGHLFRHEFLRGL
jgi:hypothetical protein